MDILRKIYDGEMSINDAYDILEPGSRVRPYEDLGLTIIESNAFLHGASIEDIARWRYEGWPKTCAICGLELPKLDEGGWFAAFGTEHGSARIVHIECLPEEIE